MKKIVYLSASTIPSKAANSVHVMKMCQAFAKHGYEVTLLAWNGGGTVEDAFEKYGVEPCFELVRFERLNIPGAILHLSLKMYKWVKENKKVDIIYGRNLYALMATAKLNKKFVLEVHSPLNSHIQSLIQRYLFSTDNFSFLVTISNALKKEYLKEYTQLKPQKVIVAHDGADFNETVVQSNLDNFKINIGYIGHMYPGRGLEVILELSKRFDDCIFHLVGGMDKDIDYWKKIFKGQKNVIFYGFIEHSKTEILRNSFDILLAPYQKKVAVHGGKVDTSKWMSPLKIFEYMSSGKPIICSNLPVLQEVLIHEKNALLCDPENTDEWVEALHKLICNEDLRSALGTEAQKILIEKYTWFKRAEDILNKIYLK
ncbi:glycosyltransferase family 4 protein [Heliorestis acidaminivorans]|uniref:Glycosyltransferase family 4 protein n=1 Tax=Heliorestis acidaminivorans TaxID=553427 RepID=A0A6I0EVX4_9FIRM|nr:glycosyltransferase family 4 protein [Heliorestis acidaminivorans]KAB2953759.1 glycosyltransferase family 4 protein [Heliorestis acidaminivorans]